MKEQEEGRLHEEFKRPYGKGRVLILGDFNFPGIDWVQDQGGKGRVLLLLFKTINGVFSWEGWGALGKWGR